tara:strand:+ start:466 stop:627 length:162 start_codon:yes stop_codon:yes gene_type:complete
MNIIILGIVLLPILAVAIPLYLMISFLSGMGTANNLALLDDGAKKAKKWYEQL